jgi:hypothetical protein
MAESSLAIEVLCSALHQTRVLSCAHLAQVVREACEDRNAPPDLIDAIEAELGVSLKRPSSEQEARLVREGLLP